MLPLALVLLLLVPPPPADDVHVVDTTGRLSPAGLEAAEAAADEWAARTTNDVVVAVVATLEGQSVEGYTADLFASWQPGVPGADNGVAVVVALDDRELRVEAGAGLADSLSLERAGEVASAALPDLRDGDVDGAVLGLVEDVIDVVDRAEAGLPPRTTQPTSAAFGDDGEEDDDGGGSDVPWLPILLVGGIAVYGIVQRLRGVDGGGYDGGGGGGWSSSRRRRSSVGGFGSSGGSRRRSSSGGSRRSTSRSSSRGGRSSGRGASRKW